MRGRRRRRRAEHCGGGADRRPGRVTPASWGTSGSGAAGQGPRRRPQIQVVAGAAIAPSPKGPATPLHAQRLPPHEAPGPMSALARRLAQAGGRLAVVDFTPPGAEAPTPADRDEDDRHGVTPERPPRAGRRRPPRGADGDRQRPLRSSSSRASRRVHPRGWGDPVALPRHADALSALFRASHAAIRAQAKASSGGSLPAATSSRQGHHAPLERRIPGRRCSRTRRARMPSCRDPPSNGIGPPRTSPPTVSTRWMNVVTA